MINLVIKQNDGAAVNYNNKKNNKETTVAKTATIPRIIIANLDTSKLKTSLFSSIHSTCKIMPRRHWDFNYSKIFNYAQLSPCILSVT